MDPPFAPPQLRPVVQILSLLAPKTQDGDQEVQKSRLQNRFSQTNGWRYNDYVHSLYTVYNIDLPSIIFTVYGPAISNNVVTGSILDGIVIRTVPSGNWKNAPPHVNKLEMYINITSLLEVIIMCQ